MTARTGTCAGAADGQGGSEPTNQAKTALQELSQRIAVCAACPLHLTRTYAVPGEGPADARVMFVGEAPGYNEDKQARPFVGQAGQFLDQLLGLAALRRQDVYITNVVKCRPPNNRDPLPLEMDTCQSWLDAQLAAIQPRVIVTLGRYSLSRFFPQESIGKVHGRILRKGSALVFPIYHPAAALHQEKMRAVIEEDFRKLGALLAHPPAEVPTPPSNKEPEASHEPQQLSLL
ncbi:MAG: uracil-DNA glycosylase [Chloroflexi bacterium]|nr:uracil-DNA glycosylase [Chloroflexota bacterium]